MNRRQGIGQNSRDSLLKDTNRQHQLAKKLIDTGKRFKPQYVATLKLKCGKWSNNNTLATLHALHMIISDMSGKSASNRIVQHKVSDSKGNSR